ncbi:MAG: cupin domain-containing protein [bacterium]
MDNLLTMRISDDPADDTYAIIACTSAPGAGPPLHVQNEMECFLVTEGLYEFTLNGVTQRRGPGSYVRVPVGVAHSYVNVAGQPSKMLIFAMPGRDHVGFLLAAGDRLPPGETGATPRPAPDPATLHATAARFGITFLPTPI